MVAGPSGHSAGATPGGAHLSVPIGQTQMATSGCLGIGMPSFLGCLPWLSQPMSQSLSLFSLENDLRNGRCEIRECVFSSRFSDPWTSTDETLALTNSHILREPFGVSPTYTTLATPGTLESWQNLWAHSWPIEMSCPDV